MSVIVPCHFIARTEHSQGASLPIQKTTFKPQKPLLFPHEVQLFQINILKYSNLRYCEQTEKRDTPI